MNEFPKKWLIELGHDSPNVRVIREACHPLNNFCHQPPLQTKLLRFLARTPAEDLSLFDATTAFRKEMIQNALSRANGNRAEAARALGLDRKYFGKLLRSLEIDKSAS